MQTVSHSLSSRIPWRQVALFVALAFGLTWAVQLVLWLTVGYGSTSSVMWLNLSMLLPAFSAMLIGLVSAPPTVEARERRRKRTPFYIAYLLYTVFYLAVVAWASGSPDRVAQASQVTTFASLLVLIVFWVTRPRAREAFAEVGLVGGRWMAWIIGWLGLVAFYGVETLLNALFGLGQPTGWQAMAEPAGLIPALLLAVLAAQTLLMNPLLGIVIVLGEEFGWRGYLQSALVRVGRVRGVLLVGVIWGLWHAPAILMGHNFPGYPVLGVLLMTLYSTGLAFVLGYAVLKTGSVWLAAFLHAINNNVGLFLTSIHRPEDPVFSFFAGGIYSLALLLVVVLLLLRDPIWRERPAATPAEEVVLV